MVCLCYSGKQMSGTLLKDEMENEELDEAQGVMEYDETQLAQHIRRFSQTSFFFYRGEKNSQCEQNCENIKAMF